MAEKFVFNDKTFDPPVDDAAEAADADADADADELQRLASNRRPLSVARTYIKETEAKIVKVRGRNQTTKQLKPFPTKVTTDLPVLNTSDFDQNLNNLPGAVLVHEVHSEDEEENDFFMACALLDKEEETTYIKPEPAACSSSSSANDHVPEPVASVACSSSSSDPDHVNDVVQQFMVACYNLSSAHQHNVPELQPEAVAQFLVYFLNPELQPQPVVGSSSSSAHHHAVVDLTGDSDVDIEQRLKLEQSDEDDEDDY